VGAGVSGVSFSHLSFALFFCCVFVCDFTHLLAVNFTLHVEPIKRLKLLFAQKELAKVLRNTLWLCWGAKRERIWFKRKCMLGTKGVDLELYLISRFEVQGVDTREVERNRGNGEEEEEEERGKCASHD